MKQFLFLVSLFPLVPAVHAQTNQDEYEIGETGAPKDYDPAKDKPRDYDASKDRPGDYDPAKNQTSGLRPRK